ncbi:MAG: DUF434 domain-containing protein [Peptostreptococcaceae bacterium]|jgi:hypothetical protein|nr:DUF434 domain-containing protein [Peptostreptococcaceae bacterium]
MSKTVKRGYLENEQRDFSEKAISKLKEIGKDLYYLLNRGYYIKNSSTFLGNHHLLSKNQRLALVRSISSKENIKYRLNKEIKDSLEDKTVYIDGFNTIITLEVALSNSLLLKCMDKTIRDLAGLRGTYKLIDKTDIAIKLIGQTLVKYKASKVVFYLDSPVSNSGKLKLKIIELLKNYDFELDIIIIPNVDSTLEKLENVITTDAIILDKCKSWFNLNRYILEEHLPEYEYVDFRDLME